MFWYNFTPAGISPPLKKNTGFYYAHNILDTEETLLEESGCGLDIMMSHKISLPSVYQSIWMVVDAVNNCPLLEMKYPTDHDVQKAIANNFLKRSDRIAESHEWECAQRLDINKRR